MSTGSRHSIYSSSRKVISWQRLFRYAINQLSERGEGAHRCRRRTRWSFSCALSRPPPWKLVRSNLDGGYIYIYVRDREREGEISVSFNAIRGGCDDVSTSTSRNWWLLRIIRPFRDPSFVRRIAYGFVRGLSKEGSSSLVDDRTIDSNLFRKR